MSGKVARKSRWEGVGSRSAKIVSASTEICCQLKVCWKPEFRLLALRYVRNREFGEPPPVYEDGGPLLRHDDFLRVERLFLLEIALICLDSRPLLAYSREVRYTVFSARPLIRLTIPL